MDESVRILGVDDSLTIRKALELVLKPAGYVLELAASGQEALDKARAFRPDVVLLDFVLPDMRGTDVCRELAAGQGTANVPVVLISAKGAEIRQAYNDVGNVVSYITKPFTPDVLISVVSEVLARSRAEGLVKVAGAVVGEAGTAAAGAEAATDGCPAASPASIAAAAPGDGRNTSPDVAAAPPPPVPVSASERAVQAADVWEEAEETAERQAERSAAAGPTAERQARARQETLDLMFETLRAGLEGVYVEEADTPAGATVDEAKSYTDLVSQLARQLAETLAQARAGQAQAKARFHLCGDGSIRSLDDALLDAYRRICRLLFRAVTAGAIRQEAADSRPRVLVVGRGDSPIIETLRIVSQQSGWQALLVSERFRQLPLLVRLYGPACVIVEATWGGALWEQLRIVRRMPEGLRLRIIGVSAAGPPSDGQMRMQNLAAAAEMGMATVLEDGPELLAALAQQILPAMDGPSSPAAAEPEGWACAAGGI